MFRSFHQPYWTLGTKESHAPPSCKPKMFSCHIWMERHIWFHSLFCRGLKNKLCKNHIAFLFKDMEITPSLQINLPLIESLRYVSDLFLSKLIFFTPVLVLQPEKLISSLNKIFHPLVSISAGKSTTFSPAIQRLPLTCGKNVLFPTTANLLFSRKFVIKIFS